MILEDLICTNIMQRGVGNVNPMKMAKCIIELERIYGIQHGGNRKSKPTMSYLKTQKDLSEQLGISVDTYQNDKKLTNLIPELQQMVENGSIKATVGCKIWAKMPQEEQEKFFEEMTTMKHYSINLFKKLSLQYVINTRNGYFVLCNFTIN